MADRNIINYLLASGAFIGLGVLLKPLLKINSHDNVKENRPVRVEVHYESKCSDCIDFFLNQLKPAVGLLGVGIIDPRLVAFGKATIEGTKFQCQHGKQECDQNRVFACIDKANGPNVERSINTISCIMKGNSEEECLSANSINQKDIVECSKSAQSLDLMKEYQTYIKDKTGSTHLDYVPKIYIDDKNDKQIQRQAEFDLRKTVCKAYVEKNNLDANSCPLVCKDVL